MRVRNVPTSVPFLRTVITALVDGALIEGFRPRAQPERLAEATLYLPTRRAGRMARDIFLDVLNVDAVILPRIVALGDIDEDELAFAQAASSAEALQLPPALDGLARRLALAQLIEAWARQLKPGDPAQAPLVLGGPASTLALADDLARLMDDMATRGVDWRALDALVPDALDKYWQLTLDFLKIARDYWPAHLEEAGRIEPAVRRDRLIDAEAARLAAHHGGPVIAAGSTGSMPSTAKLLHVIARLPHGAVVLPGLDTDLDDEAWQLIGGMRDGNGAFTAPPAAGHPQFALHGLLRRFGIARRDVETLGVPAPYGREMLTSEAMRPSEATARWHTRLAEPEVAEKIAAGMKNLAVIAAANPEVEALSIAAAMREARELNKTAALVTFDRALARRVMAALGRWNLAFDDSGGDALMDTPAGIFARLVAGTACNGLEPPTLLALLKHPLCRLGRVAGGWSRAVATLELAILRGTRPPPGSKGLADEFARFCGELDKLDRGESSSLHRTEPRAALKLHRLDESRALIAALRDALAPLEGDGASRSADFTAFAAQHREAIDVLSRDDQGVAAAFEGQHGLALAAAFDDLRKAGERSGLTVKIADYPEVFETAFGDRIVRRPQATAASLRIYGPLEARLTQCDRVILGGLNESVWPPAPPSDPWLSRPMRHELGLDLPERRIGLSAHDFAQLLGADDVILSHAAKAGGSPAVASRFLHRLKAVAGPERWATALQAGTRYVQYAEAIDRPEQVTPVAQPEPKPPRAARPTRLSVTAIEDWLRDPYTIYAKHILKLLPLEAVDMPLSAADRGSAIHNSLGDFTKQYPAALPENPADVLRAIGESRFAPLMQRPEARALWWPRFQRIAAWFAEWEQSRRPQLETIDAEIRGEISIPVASDRTFHLSARADRIEHLGDGRFTILDYKTGSPPSSKQVRLGLSPQLTLESAILREGGFEGIPAGASVSELVYVRLSGNNPPGEPLQVNLDNGKTDMQSPDQAADRALEELNALIRAFDNEQQGYPSLDLPMWKTRYGAYDDLARIKEWSAAGGLGIEEW
ncbi:DNA helicase/exodeoxyribonuclease V, subunit B [Nitrobacter hamburgensis X14]|uniref:DNA helicase/exodeoxyribonuclease V, subunit B n=1 Tax=Nitrobacter hamburgensis (strain DSM 10229 / NCIMB 13809 / X14) TaxID=323097 RepID=Q1QS39_NITHX|nr:double-strand break repair protein AddB [Nitrobacter hamburgensis]ABE60958.1 DNA helicase/exodeoxyribonuclease V, subunit B [Nitrobacter hamburgensis X14]